MNEIRQCGNCGHPTLIPTQRKMQIYNSVFRYKCGNCDNEVELVPTASTGAFACAGALVLAFWGYILFFHGSSTTGAVAITLYGMAVLLLIVMVGCALIKHIRNPIVQTADGEREVPLINERHIGLRPILWLEKLGFFAGLMAPIVIGALVLGAATAIGYVNFTYFSG